MSINLITLSDYKVYAGINSTTQDAAISSLISRVSTLIKRICKRSFVDFVSTSKVDVFNGGLSTYILSEGPLIGVLGVEYSPDYGQNYTDLVEYTDYVLTTDSETGIINLLTTTTSGLPNAYRVIYNCGYTEVPLDLALAAMDLVTYYLKNDTAIHSTKSAGSNAIQIEYITKTDLPAHIKRVLDLYSDNYN